MRPARLRNRPSSNQRGASDGKGGAAGLGQGHGLWLTAAGGPQGDIAGQGELYKGGDSAGIELAGLPYQALGCVWELHAFDLASWEDLDGVFTSGLKAEKESWRLTYGDPCPSPVPCCPLPLPSLFPF